MCLHGSLGVVVLGDAVENGLNVDFFGDPCRRDSSRCGAELEVDNAIGLEIREDGIRGIDQGGEVVDESVDVSGEQWKESRKI